MNYLLNSDGDSITVPDEVYLFKGLVSFLDFSIRGEFSTNFTIPNDSETRKALGFSSINQVNATPIVQFDFYKNGNKVSTGFVYIQKITNTFDIFFAGGNANWIQTITGTLKDLDLSGYDLTFNAVNIASAMANTEGVIFPVIDWCYNYKKLTNTFLASSITGVSVNTFYDFYPCMFVHTILRRMFEDRGIKVAGNLWDDPTFKAIVITPEMIVSSAYTSSITNQYTQSMTDAVVTGYGLGGGPKLIAFNSGSSDFVDATDSITFTNAYTAATAILTLVVNGGSSGTVYLFKNGVQVASVPVSSGVQTANISYETGPIAIADVWTVRYASSGLGIVQSGSLQFNLSNTVNSQGQVQASSFLPPIDQFEFLKTYCTRFNCLLEFDSQTQTLTFTILDKIDKASATDLSANLSSAVQIPFSGYKERNYVRTTEAEELIGYKTSNLNYGDRLIESDGEGEGDVFKTIMRPAETFTNFNLDWLITSVPIVRLEDADEGVEYSSVNNVGGSAQFAGAAFAYNQYDIVRVDNFFSGTYAGFFVVESGSGGLVNAIGTIPYTGTGAGRIFRQKIVFPSIGSRELLVHQIDINDINQGSLVYGNQNIILRDTVTASLPITSVAWAHFAKPNIGTDLDRIRVGLNYGPVPNTGNIPFGTLYHKNMTKIVQNSRVKAGLLLSQVEYKNLDLSNFVYLRTKDFTGYFLIEKIDGYKNQYTEVGLDLIMMD
jgi:hypothetical protein